MEKTLMLFGDAKVFVASIVKELNAAVSAVAVDVKMSETP
jgi:hypothetical protein